jgi:predicted Zn-dependent protease
MAKKAIVLMLTGLIVYACATVPITGRKQLAMVSNDEIIPLASQQYGQVLKDNKLSTNQEYVAMVRKVGGRIQKAVEQFMTEKGLSAELDGFKWEFNVIDDPKTVNAWCMPGGKVAFYSGIMPICKDENGVAVVMGHEVAHAIANHGRERMSQGLLANGLLGTISGAMGQNPTLTQNVFLQAMGMGTQIGMLKFSRQHESEADRIGLIFMAMAGYDPHEAPKFWERMMKMGSGEQPPEWLSTHPAHETRINDLNAEIPEAMKYYKGN